MVSANPYSIIIYGKVVGWVIQRSIQTSEIKSCVFLKYDRLNIYKHMSSFRIKKYIETQTNMSSLSASSLSIAFLGL